MIKAVCALAGAAVLLAVTTVPASAKVPSKTYYAAPTATGSADCSDPADACAFATAVSKTNLDDTIDLAGGTYGSSKGFVLDQITVQAESGAAPIFHASLSKHQIFTTSGAQVTIVGVTLEDTKGASALVNTATSLTLTDDQFTDNDASNTQGTGSGSGGAVRDETGARISITGSVFTGNLAQFSGVGFGGAIYATGGVLDVVDSRFIANTAAHGAGLDGSGGAIYVTSEDVVIRGSVLEGNRADDADPTSAAASNAAGAAMFVLPNGSAYKGDITIEDSTVSDNIASNAAKGSVAVGALDLVGAATATIIDSTVADNVGNPTLPAAATGAITTQASAVLGAENTTVVESTIVGNNNGPTSSGGAAVVGQPSPATFDLVADVIAKNVNGSQCAVTTDLGYNRADDASCNLTLPTSSTPDGLDQSLGALTTEVALPVIPITATSPAAGQIPSTATLPTSGSPPDCSVNDERGVLRPANHCDVGAYERTPVITTSLTSSHPKTRFGWWRAPVTVHFRCAATDLPITCPAARTRSHSGRHQVVTVSASTVSDEPGTATATAIVSIDRTKPRVKIKGLTPHKVYRHKPHLRCDAKDSLSGVASCTLKTHVNGGIAHVTARAKDRAGNITVARRTYRLV